MLNRTQPIQRTLKSDSSGIEHSARFTRTLGDRLRDCAAPSAEFTGYDKWLANPGNSQGLMHNLLPQNALADQASQL